MIEKYEYPAQIALEMFSGKWTLHILFHLRDKTVRFCEFPKLIPGITQKVLTKQLKKLEANDLIERTVYPEIPPKVEYKLTEYGKSMIPILDTLNDWGKDHLKKTK